METEREGTEKIELTGTLNGTIFRVDSESSHFQLEMHHVTAVTTDTRKKKLTHRVCKECGAGYESMEYEPVSKKALVKVTIEIIRNPEEENEDGIR
ncbi:MAG: hypothetical protein WC998_00820 [Candidatus Paceibacterota bacterium]|jgi:ribosomal protein L32